MKIKDVFEEIFTGYNMTNATGNNKEPNEIYLIQKDSIQYTNIIKNKLICKKIATDIKNKYYMQPRDIIISLKKPYKVGTLRTMTNKKIIIPNNFIILRGINRDLYSFIFVPNYLEKIGIKKYTEEKNITSELTLENIKNIELPDIPKSKQMKISNLMNHINDRSAIYNNILENDDKIIRYALNEIIGDDNVK